jgi:chromosome segregation ATPase
LLVYRKSGLLCTAKADATATNGAAAMSAYVELAHLREQLTDALAEIKTLRAELENERCALQAERLQVAGLRLQLHESDTEIKKLMEALERLRAKKA